MHPDRACAPPTQTEPWTPQGHLGRGMRHLDGLYMRRLNRLTGTDGSLFRGR